MSHSGPKLSDLHKLSETKLPENQALHADTYPEAYSYIWEYLYPLPGARFSKDPVS